jgi:periplasmic protein TonB
MTSTNHTSIILNSPFLCNARHIGIITSVIMHAAVMLLFVMMPVVTITPSLQTIQVSLEQPDISSKDATEGTKQKAASGVNQVQNKINPKTLLKPLPVQKKEVFRENTVSGRQDAIKPVLIAAKPVVAAGRNLEVAGSINAENQGVVKAKASITSQAESRGIAETQFGEIGAPAFIHREMPVYPIMARRLGKEGKVVLKLLIDKNGKLQSVEVVESVGFGFTEAAVAAVKNSTYAPASRNGEKITARALIPVRFRLQ